MVRDGPSGGDRRRRRWFVWAPHHLGWSASAVQLAGTLWFNLSTGYAIHTNLSAATADARVWRPDALGSIAFLVASTIAWVEVCHGWWAWRPHSLGWWITVANLVGSIAFGASAVASYVVPTTETLRNVELSNLGTFVGALCFLAGAVLLMPERVAGPDARVQAQDADRRRAGPPPTRSRPTAGPRARPAPSRRASTNTVVGSDDTPSRATSVPWGSPARG